MNKIYLKISMFNYLAVVFLNAFTDLGHKIIMQNTIFKVYDGQTQIVLTAVVNALIILPFILMFSPAGFLADKLPKNKIMKYSSLFAVFITLGIVYAYYHGRFIEAFIMTFLLAFQSALYAPAKYGYIKELYGESKISLGNASVQAVTTVAILGGIIFYSVLFEFMFDDGLKTKEDILIAIAPIGWLLVIGSLIELFLAYKLPTLVPRRVENKFLFLEYIKGLYIRENLKITTKNRDIFKAIIYLGFFWSISQVILAVFGEYAKSELNVTNTIYVQGVMALAGVGIIIGSIFTVRFSKHYINLGLVGIGFFGISVSIVLIPFVESMYYLIFIFMFFGIFASFIIVPLNANIQMLSKNSELGIVLAGNNFIQNIFMLFFLVLTTIFAYVGLDTKIFIYCMGIIGILLTYFSLKENLLIILRSIIDIIFGAMYKYECNGLENVPEEGAVLFTGNHTSWIDWEIVKIPFSKRIKFLISKDVYDIPILNFFFKLYGHIPISNKVSKDAIIKARAILKEQGRMVVFPEGSITSNGELKKFYSGYSLICKDCTGVIVPFFIDGAFGTIFSKRRIPKKFFFKRRKISIYFAKPVPMDTDKNDLKIIIQDLKDKYESK